MSDDNIRPSLRAVFLDREFSRIMRFSITGTVTNIYDGWSFDLSGVDPDTISLIKDRLEETPRWIPIVLFHSDPQVQGGRSLPALQGIITRARLADGAGPVTLTLSGYDLGKLFDSSGPAYYRIRGHTWGQLLDKMIDPSWKSTSLFPSDWGLKGVRGIDLNKKLKVGRIGAVQDYGKRYQDFMPPVQIEPGEVCYDTLSRYARLTAATPGGSGCIVNVSSDGWVQIFNPDDAANDKPLYTLNYTRDKRNQRIKSGDLDMNCEGLGSEYRVYGSVVRFPYKQDSRDPNAGRFFAKAPALRPLGVRRLQATSDAEQYTPAMAAARAQWRARQAEFFAWTLTYVMQGHSMPGPDGTWTPLVEGNIAEVTDTVRGISDRLLVESVTRTQDINSGTTATVVLRKRGLLSG